MTIVDTSVWIDYLAGTVNPHAIWLDRALPHKALALTDLILCEVLQGIRDDGQFAGVLNDLRRFQIFDTGGEALAEASAMNYRWLRTRRFTVRKTIDCYIATFCISRGYSLLHRDRDFDVFEKHLGLQVVHL